MGGNQHQTSIIGKKGGSGAVHAAAVWVNWICRHGSLSTTSSVGGAEWGSDT